LKKTRQQAKYHIKNPIKIYKTLPRKPKIEQLKPHKIAGMISGAPETSQNTRSDLRCPRSVSSSCSEAAITTYTSGAARTTYTSGAARTTYTSGAAITTYTICMRTEFEMYTQHP
jgi:hypothetical protein